MVQEHILQKIKSSKEYANAYSIFCQKMLFSFIKILTIIHFGVWLALNSIVYITLISSFAISYYTVGPKMMEQTETVFFLQILASTFLSLEYTELQCMYE